MQMQPISRRFASITLVLLIATGTTRAGDVYYQTNLITNATDPNLINPWGVSFSGGSPLWVSDQGTGVSTLYSINPTTNQVSVLPLVVPIPNQGGAAPSGANGPTGQVSTSQPGVSTPSNEFQVNGGKASFIFDNLDGSISAWRGGLSNSVIETSVTGASFTGLAISNVGSAAQIYAADQNSNNVYIFNGSWTKTGSLTDPNIPSNFTAFNVQNIGGTLYVTYANPNSPFGGYVDEFNTSGTLIKQLIADPNGTSGNGHLDTPWGLAIAPAGWGKFGGDLLVGNNDGDGTINAYNLQTGAWAGQIMLNSGQPFSETELWAISFGNGTSAGSTNDLYFVAGLANQAGGLIGELSAVPEPSSALLGLIAAGVLAGCWQLKNRRRRTAA
jgi:uncharacterized protein (TIGR03118 family)